MITPTSSPINHVVTQNTTGGTRHPFLPSFTLFAGGKEKPYGMSTALMADLQTNASKYADNAMVVAFSVNNYMTSESAINNLGLRSQPQ